MLMEFLRMLLSSILGTVGFAILIHAPKRSLFPASLVGGAAYMAFWLMTSNGVAEPTAMLLAALFGSVMAQQLARKMHMIATIFILLAIVSLVPGLGLYRFMELLGSGETSEGAKVGVAAMTSIAMLALGIGMGNFVSKLIHNLQKHIKA